MRAGVVLPPELIAKVAKHLPPEDLVSAACVNKAWHKGCSQALCDAAAQKAARRPADPKSSC